MENVNNCYAGLTYQEIWKTWSARHGDIPQNETIHRRWKSLGKRIAAGARTEPRRRRGKA